MTEHHIGCECAECVRTRTEANVAAHIARMAQLAAEAAERAERAREAKAAKVAIAPKPTKRLKSGKAHKSDKSRKSVMRVTPGMSEPTPRGWTNLPKADRPRGFGHNRINFRNGPKPRTSPTSGKSDLSMIPATRQESKMSGFDRMDRLVRDREAYWDKHGYGRKCHGCSDCTERRNVPVGLPVGRTSLKTPLEMGKTRLY